METCWLLDHFALATLLIVIEDTNLVFLTGSIMISGQKKLHEITSRRVSNFIFTRVRFSPDHPEKTCCFATSYACYTSIIQLIHSDEGLMP